MLDRIYESRHVAIACFAGLAVGVMVALISAPAFWHAGVLAGFATAILAYHFRLGSWIAQAVVLSGFALRFIVADRRVFCGINAALATALSYWFFVRPEQHLELSRALAVILGGGLMSMLLAALSWELVSKRLLKLVPAAR